MKRISLIALLSFLTLCCSAQMFVWKNGVVQYALRTSTADSITFYEPADYGEIHPVDLGLPSGIKWADKNLGATAPSEVGTPYAWGETETKETFTIDNYIQNFSAHGLSTSELDEDYNSRFEIISQLPLSTDPAQKNLGRGWRLPTYEELEELLNNCTTMLTIRDGVQGRILRASNGAEIFLVAENGDYSWLWTSTLNSARKAGICQVVLNEFASFGAYTGDIWEKGYIRPVFDESLLMTSAPNTNLFAISKNQYITFAPGNLQHNPSLNILRFADNQYDYIGAQNANISSTYVGWLDLFEWGYGNDPSHIYSSGSGTKTSFDEWGDNPITNNNNIDASGTWRTLSYEEWAYVLHNRPNAASLKGTAQVNGIYGVILLPDEWVLPQGCSFTPIEDNGTVNQYSIAEWNTMEAAGAVFLPAAGRRSITTISMAGNCGFYWASSNSSCSGKAIHDFFYINDAKMYMSAALKSYQGFSVRLVKDYVE